MCDLQSIVKKKKSENETHFPPVLLQKNLPGYPLGLNIKFMINKKKMMVSVSFSDQQKV